MAVGQTLTADFRPSSGGIFDAFDVSGTGLSAQRRKLNAIASNIANADTTRTEEGGPYKRKRVVMIESPYTQRFRDIFNETEQHLSGTHRDHLPAGPGSAVSELLGAGVESVEVREEPTEPRLVYDPAHPDARDDGYVVYPDVNVMTEMVDMITASRAYEANVTAMNAAKDMIQRALEI